jgi:hypothetical protein
MIAAAAEIKFNLGKFASLDAAPIPNLSFNAV